MPMLNVLEASLSAANPLAAVHGPKDAVVLLHAQVLPETKPLTVDNKGFNCLVIEYRGEQFVGSTWVDEKTGLVLKQEQQIGADTWSMLRESGL
jgi:hypothetical protein